MFFKDFYRERFIQQLFHERALDMRWQIVGVTINCGLQTEEPAELILFFVKKAVSEEEVILILHLEFESFCL